MMLGDFNIRNTRNYVLRTLKANQRLIENEYKQHYSAFYNWHVGQLKGADIPAFLESYFNSKDKEKTDLLVKQCANPKLAMLLVDAFNEVLNSLYNETSVSYANLKDLDNNIWFDIRMAFNSKVKLSNAEDWITGDKSVVDGKSGEVSTDPQRLSDDKDEAKQSEVEGVMSFNGFAESLNVKIRDYLSYDSDTLFINLDFEDERSLLCRLLISEMNYAHDKLPQLKQMRDEVQDLLSEAYQDINIETSHVEIDDVECFCLVARFKLNFIEINPQYEEKLYYIHGDDIYVQLT